MSTRLDGRRGWIGASSGTWKGVEVHSKIAFLDAFTKLRKTNISFIICPPVYLFVLLHGTTTVPVHGFSGN